jgi:hypothetical protein
MNCLEAAKGNLVERVDLCKQGRHGVGVSGRGDLLGTNMNYGEHE